MLASVLRCGWSWKEANKSGKKNTCFLGRKLRTKLVFLCTQGHYRQYCISKNQDFVGSLLVAPRGCCIYYTPLYRWFVKDKLHNDNISFIMAPSTVMFSPELGSLISLHITFWAQISLNYIVWSVAIEQYRCGPKFSTNGPKCWATKVNILGPNHPNHNEGIFSTTESRHHTV